MLIKNLEKVIILGAGGTGSFVLPALARYLYSEDYKGELYIIDGDSYSQSNLNRQIFAAQYCNMNKAEYQASVLTNHLPMLADRIKYIDQYLGVELAEEFITENTIVINCTDNLAARKIIEDRCLALQNSVHICCGNEKASGQVQMAVRKNGKQVSRSIYDSVPQFDSMDGDRSKMSCEELAALPGGGQLICANMMAASIALNMFMQVTSSNKIYKDGEWIPCDTVWYYCNNNNFDREGIQEFVGASSNVA